MKTKHYVGTTAENDALSLPEGMLSIDSEKKALRIHDGSTVGGYEILGERAVTASLYGPGPQTLLAGDMTAGFFGEVTSSELLTYEALASQIGLSAGTSINNVESLWLKFALDGRVLYVAKKPARYNISWANINSVNAIFGGGSLVIPVGSHTFDVTLLGGVGSDPAVIGSDGTLYGHDIDMSHGSEWNRLLYPIHSGVHADTSNPSTHTDPNAAAFGSWATYSDSDLILNGSDGNGSYSWAKEVSSDSSSSRIARGAVGMTYCRQFSTTQKTNVFGWRPCLRLTV